ncbi:MAG: cation diffusion facilitator family transporter [Bdellovibrionales bacterium]
MRKTVFSIPKMDCPSEEGLIRMALEKSSKIKNLKFDLKNRELTIIHEESDQTLLNLLTPLGFGAVIKASSEVLKSDEVEVNLEPDTATEAKTLKILLLINAGMFLIEIVLGLVAQSTGLISDSLDMFADAAVYGVSLYAVGKTLKLKQKAARISGYMQLLLAVFAFSEVVRRFIYGSEPESSLMIGVAILALIANVSCLFLIYKHREGEVHMKASWIFSTNDVLANIGVIVAGVIVRFTGSALPDLVIGFIIAFIVLSGAIRILRLSKVSV